MKILGLAWKDVEDARTMIQPEHAIAMLPAGPGGNRAAPASAPELSIATY